MISELVTAITTLAVGIMLYTLNSVWQHGHVEPILKYRELRSLIKSTIFFNKDKLSNPLELSKLSESQYDYRRYEDYMVSKKELRKIAAEVVMFNAQIKKDIRKRDELGIPSYEKLEIASNNLIGLSNSLFKDLPQNEEMKFKREIFSELNDIFQLDIK